MKVTIAKNLALGETIAVELDEPTEEALERAFKLVDRRLWEMNQRILALNTEYKRVVQQQPDIAMLVNDILLMVTGQKVIEDKTTEAA